MRLASTTTESSALIDAAMPTTLPPPSHAWSKHAQTDEFAPAGGAVSAFDGIQRELPPTRLQLFGRGCKVAAKTSVCGLGGAAAGGLIGVTAGFIATLPLYMRWDRFEGVIKGAPLAAGWAQAAAGGILGGAWALNQGGERWFAGAWAVNTGLLTGAVIWSGANVIGGDLVGITCVGLAYLARLKNLEAIFYAVQPVVGATLGVAAGLTAAAHSTISTYESLREQDADAFQEQNV